MTRKQWLIVILLGVGDAIVLGLLGFAMATGIPAPTTPEVAATTPILSETLTPPPAATWTPVPSPSQPALPSPTPSPPTPTPRSLAVREDVTYNEIEGRVVGLRQLDKLRSIPRWVIDESELDRRMEETFRDDALRAEIQSIVHVLSALDLMAPDEDLATVLEELFAEQVVGFYDTETEAVYIVTDESINRVENRMTFVHEVTHALQDQHFDLETLGLYGTDQAYFFSDGVGAVHALIEGDAELVQEQYGEQYLSEQEMLAYQFASVDIGRTRLEAAPRVIREVVQFPYIHGYTFVSELYDEGGWNLVDGAYLLRPTSTEQILHPERYLADDQPLTVTLPSLRSVLGEDWEPIHEATLGEFLLRLHLENWLDDAEAVLASEGWGGDRYAVYYDASSNQTVSLLRLRWDTPEDGFEFLLFYTAWVEGRFGNTANTLTDNLSCWDGADALCFTWDEEMTVTIVRAPSRDLIDRILVEALFVD
jgi:hypothetical protein